MSSLPRDEQKSEELFQTEVSLPFKAVAQLNSSLKALRSCLLVCKLWQTIIYKLFDWSKRNFYFLRVFLDSAKFSREFGLFRHCEFSLESFRSVYARLGLDEQRKFYFLFKNSHPLLFDKVCSCSSLFRLNDRLVQPCYTSTCWTRIATLANSIPPIVSATMYWHQRNETELLMRIIWRTLDRGFMDACGTRFYTAIELLGPIAVERKTCWDVAWSMGIRRTRNWNWRARMPHRTQLPSAVLTILLNWRLSLCRPISTVCFSLSTTLASRDSFFTLSPDSPLRIVTFLSCCTFLAAQASSVTAGARTSRKNVWSNVCYCFRTCLGPHFESRCCYCTHGEISSWSQATFLDFCWIWCWSWWAWISLIWKISL